MGKYRVEIEKTAKVDFEKIYKSGNKSTIKKLENIIKELSEHPQTGIGNPEPLKYHLTGFWSRRLNKKDRLIYKIQELKEFVIIISALGHYE